MFQHISTGCRSTGGEWQIWECLDTPDTRAVMQKLAKGQEYQFRVIATNKAGKSEPSVPSRPKLAKETDCKSYHKHCQFFKPELFSSASLH